MRDTSSSLSDGDVVLLRQIRCVLSAGEKGTIINDLMQGDLLYSCLALNTISRHKNRSSPFAF